jgi:hypothetical protein
MSERSSDYESSDRNEAANTVLSESSSDYESSGYSPQYMSQIQLDPGTFVINNEDGQQRLVFVRRQMQNSGSSDEVRTG